MREVLGGGIAALGSGALAGFGALGGVGMLASASTGTAIASLTEQLRLMQPLLGLEVVH